jgi:hypothetical protein
MYSWIVLLVVFLILGFSLVQRLRYFRQLNDTSEMKISPLSLAIQELLAVAGGIYLSLVMLISFLRLNIPDKIKIFELTIDPIASTAILLTIIQPFFLKVYNKNSKE